LIVRIKETLAKNRTNKDNDSGNGKGKGNRLLPIDDFPKHKNTEMSGDNLFTTEYLRKT
jgi:hypothetical protein